MHVNPSRNFQIVKRWLPLLRGPKKYREALASVWRLWKLSAGWWSWKLAVLMCTSAGKQVCRFAAQYPDVIDGGQGARGQGPQFWYLQYPTYTAAGGKYLEDSLARFSEVHSLFLTFPSNGELDWEWGSYQIPISIFPLWMFPV